MVRGLGRESLSKYIFSGHGAAREEKPHHLPPGKLPGSKGDYGPHLQSRNSCCVNF